jgi:glutathione peroxidase
MAEARVFDFTLRSLEGPPLPLSQFQGKVMLVVNTASECGFTPQYAGLEALHREYGPRGLVVLGCPCNQFGSQEPGPAAEIGAFCEQRFGVSFPMSEKLEVKGPGADPLFRHLCATAPGLLGTRAIKWNFTKFLVARDGKTVERYAPATPPEDLRSRIEALLGDVNRP